MEIQSTANFYFVEIDFKQLRDEADLTLEQVSVAAGYAVATIGALEVEGRGSDRLKQKLLEIYGRKKSFDTDRSHILHDATESDLKIWKRRAELAEKDLAELRAGLRRLLDKSSSKPLSEAQRIAQRAGDQFDAEHSGKS